MSNVRMKYGMWSAAVVAFLAGGASAAMVTDLGNGVGGAAGTGNGGNDSQWQFNSTYTTAHAVNLLVKRQFATADSGGNTDRIASLKFDTTGLGTPSAIQYAALNLTVQDNGTHAFPVGYTYQLYGIPDGATQELTDPNTLNASTSLYTTYTTGTTQYGNHLQPSGDTVVNRVDDTLLTYLGSYTVQTVPAGGSIISIQSDALAAFLRADTNGVATFLLTSPTSTTTPNPTVFSSQNATGMPTLATNLDVPEPASLGLLSIGLAVTGLRRRRSC